MAKVAVIIAAAGKSERFCGAEKKTFAKLDGRPVFIRTLEMFINRDDVCQTILVVPPEDADQMKDKYGANLGFMGVKLVQGGAERHQSVEAGLAEMSDQADLVAVHDAARPCVTEAMIDAVFAEAVKSGAAILACPLTGTIKRAADSGVVDATVPRENLYEAQTPQVFKPAVLREAFAKRPQNGAQITDDAQVVELAGHPVAIVKSDATNIKITAKADMALAAAIIRSRPSKARSKLGAFEEAQW